VDNFWSRDDIRVHTFGGFAEGRWSPRWGICSRASPTRTAARLCGRVQSA